MLASPVQGTASTTANATTPVEKPAHPHCLYGGPQNRRGSPRSARNAEGLPRMLQVAQRTDITEGLVSARPGQSRKVQGPLSGSQEAAPSVWSGREAAWLMTAEAFAATVAVPVRGREVSARRGRTVPRLSGASRAWLQAGRLLSWRSDES